MEESGYKVSMVGTLYAKESTDAKFTLSNQVLGTIDTWMRNRNKYTILDQVGMKPL